MINKWRSPAQKGNFGDDISDLFLELASKQGRQQLNSKKLHYHLIGSVINDYWLEQAGSDEAADTFFWGCGFRGERIFKDTLLGDVQICGVRGYETRNYLRHHNIDAPVIGDTAFLLPLIIKKSHKYEEKSYFMPHILDPKRFDYNPQELGVDEILQPDVSNLQDVKVLIKKLASARFVLAGAMHAGIVACAYGRPFAFFESEKKDSPIKYTDFLTAMDKDLYATFHKDAHLGRAWYKTHKHALIFTKRHLLVKYAPFSVKKEFVIRAWVGDIQAMLVKLKAHRS